MNVQEMYAMTQDEHPIIDLRSALDRLRAHPGQLIETDHPVDPNGELAGVNNLKS